MLPLHASGVAACTYHFFYNSPDVGSLVTLQVSVAGTASPACHADLVICLMGSC